ncbi:group-specific protein [Priestia flexa]|uniref:group-specific protein n=1 Tax=Priestia flexa TaxID=86664 RepID=UPI00240E2D77|nr:group-specific protein [Priestia flexa]WEZ09979.1 group-specific protein [Priestia flexa]
MLEVHIDEVEVKKIYLDEIKKKLKEVNNELVFWDTKELRRRTCMSWSTIQKEFLYNDQFPKYKVGTKWYFPADATKDFLLSWLEEQQIS